MVFSKVNRPLSELCCEWKYFGLLLLICMALSLCVTMMKGVIDICVNVTSMYKSDII
jgi:hypothetical protein